MKNLTLAVAVGTTLTATTIGSNASPTLAATFNISFTINEGGGVTEDVVGQLVTGNTLMTDPMTGFSGFKITSFTGTQDGNPISLLEPGEFGRPGFPNNNLFNPNFIKDPDLIQDPNDAAFDLKGVSYNELESGDLEPYQLYYDGTDYRGYDESGSPNLPFLVTDLEATRVPEPNTILGILAFSSLGILTKLKRK